MYNAFQYYQWFCIAFERGAQGLSAEGVTAPAQSEVPQCVPSTAGLLCRTIPREGSQPHRTGG